MQANGGVTLQLRPGVDFISLGLPKKAQADWRKFWFYMLESTPLGQQAIPQFTSELSQPKNLQAVRLSAEERAIVAAMRARIEELKKEGLKTINVYNCWLARRIPPLRERGHLMCKYTGQNDPTRSNATLWSPDDYAKMLKKVTTAGFTGFDAPLQPFTVENEAPTVSFP